MDTGLSDELVQRFRRDGILALVPSVGEAGGARLFDLFLEYEPEVAGTFAGNVPRKPHLLLPWLNALIRDPRILDAVESLIGPDIFCWSANFFAKRLLEPGEMSLHHVLIVHGSSPKPLKLSSYRRRRYVAAHVAQTSGVRDSATLVRGTDRFGNFEHEPTPRFDFDPDVVAYHDALAERSAKIQFEIASRRLRLSSRSNVRPEYCFGRS